MKYVPDNVHIVKDNLFEAPEIFRIIQQSSGADDKEMYQVFNMGCRLEIYTDEKNADKILSAAREHYIDAQIIGRVEEAPGKKLLITNSNTQVEYSFND
jgi:phosphoribosylformylglycinamidine cyclo-ligase